MRTWSLFSDGSTLTAAGLDVSADKRMAVHVEDPPVDYGDFERVIPNGYGAVIVLLWDRGTWTPDPQTPDIDAALKAGELNFSLEGVNSFETADSLNHAQWPCPTICWSDTRFCLTESR